MASSPSVTSYINTLVFCIIAKFVSIVLLIMLFTVPNLMSFSYLIVTIELGLVFIIVNALISIQKYVKKREEVSRKNLENVIQLSLCPDYFTKSYTDSDGVICSSHYITPDKRYKYYIGSATNRDVFLDKEFNNKKVHDVCNIVREEYNAIPWTDLKSKCENV